MLVLRAGLTPVSPLRTRDKMADHPHTHTKCAQTKWWLKCKTCVTSSQNSEKSIACLSGRMENFGVWLFQNVLDYEWALLEKCSRLGCGRQPIGEENSLEQLLTGLTPRFVQDLVQICEVLTPTGANGHEWPTSQITATWGSTSTNQIRLFLLALIRTNSKRVGVNPRVTSLRFPTRAKWRNHSQT